MCVVIILDGSLRLQINTGCSTSLWPKNGAQNQARDRKISHDGSSRKCNSSAGNYMSHSDLRRYIEHKFPPFVQGCWNISKGF